MINVPGQALNLLPIDVSGLVPAAPGPLPDVAREVCEGMAALYGAGGFVPPWIGYLAQVDAQLVGTCAFKGPLRDGRVEIAYFTFPEHEGRGVATRMVKALLAMAAEAVPDAQVTAQTLPEQNASASVLKRNAFRFAGTVEHPEDGTVWEWTRPAGGT